MALKLRNKKVRPFRRGGDVYHLWVTNYSACTGLQVKGYIERLHPWWKRYVWRIQQWMMGNL